MIWAIVILLGLICLLIYGQLSAVNEKLGEILSDTRGIRGGIEDVADRSHRGISPEEEENAARWLDKERKEEEARLREIEEGIEKKSGAWSKATLARHRYSRESLTHEYTLVTSNRTYTVGGVFAWKEPVGEVMYMVSPTFPSLYVYLRCEGEEVREFDILEEKLRKYPPREDQLTDRSLFD